MQEYRNNLMRCNTCNAIKLYLHSDNKLFQSIMDGHSRLEECTLKITESIEVKKTQCMHYKLKTYINQQEYNIV